MKSRNTERTKAPIGSGQRFKALVGQLSHMKDVHDPSAIAAMAGRAKYGKSRFQAMAAAGRKRHMMD